MKYRNDNVMLLRWWCGLWGGDVACGVVVWPMGSCCSPWGGGCDLCGGGVAREPRPLLCSSVMFIDRHINSTTDYFSKNQTMVLSNEIQSFSFHKSTSILYIHGNFFPTIVPISGHNPRINVQCCELFFLLLMSPVLKHCHVPIRYIYLSV